MRFPTYEGFNFTLEGSIEPYSQEPSNRILSILLIICNKKRIKRPLKVSGIIYDTPSEGEQYYNEFIDISIDGSFVTTFSYYLMDIPKHFKRIPKLYRSKKYSRYEIHDLQSFYFIYASCE